MTNGFCCYTINPETGSRVIPAEMTVIEPPNPRNLIRVMPAEGEYRRVCIFRCPQDPGSEFCFSEGAFMKSMTTRCLVEAAICVALAQVLGYIKFWQLPLGGSVTLSMLPIVLFAIRWGVGPGLLCGLVFGFLQLTLDMSFSAGWQSILGDYLFAFAPLGLAGLFCRVKGGVFYGMVLGAFGRFLVHFVTGATVWAEYMPESFSNPWVYSLCYNGAYMGLSLAACLVVFAVIYAPLKKYLCRVETAK